MKNINAWLYVVITSILIGTILGFPINNAQAYTMFPTVDSVEKLHIDKHLKEHLVNSIINSDIKKLEQDFRKANNIPIDTKIYVEISTNPPVVLHKSNDIVPAGTTVYGFDSPLEQTYVLMPLWAAVTVVVIAIVVAGVVIYVVYKVLKCLDKAINNGKTNNTETATYHAEVSKGLCAVNSSNNPNFDIASEISNTRLTNDGTNNNFDVTNFTGTIIFDIQSSIDLFNWVTEYHVVNDIVNAKSSVSIYDSTNKLIMNNNSSGIFDGESLIFAPDYTGVLVKDKAVDAYKFWRIR